MILMKLSIKIIGRLEDFTESFLESFLIHEASRRDQLFHTFSDKLESFDNSQNLGT